MYYNDPLKAAWMAREFGVRYIEEGYRVFSFPVGEQFYRPPTDRANIYAIHADSLSIFDPMEGDVGMSDCNEVCKFIDRKWYIIKTLMWDMGSDYVNQASIIQRNGKAFFHPEVEE